MNSYSCDIIMFTIDIDTSYCIVVWLPQVVQELETESYVHVLALSQRYTVKAVMQRRLDTMLLLRNCHMT